MPKPITPLCGCDVFIGDSAGRVLLVQRSDNGLWALPGGCQEIDETPAECAIRECVEETGMHVRLTRLLGVWSSRRYEYVNYPWKDNVFTHLVFAGEIIGGAVEPSKETPAVLWFPEADLPTLSDGHAARIRFGFQHLKAPEAPAFFE